MLYLDSSVLVPFYLPEANSGRVQRLPSSDEPAAISPLSEVEFHSTVARLVRMKDISAGDGRRVLDEFATHVRTRLYSFCPVTQGVFEAARDWLGTFDT